MARSRPDTGMPLYIGDNRLDQELARCKQEEK
jgi:hypothetical protein